MNCLLALLLALSFLISGCSINISPSASPSPAASTSAPGQPSSPSSALGNLSSLPHTAIPVTWGALSLTGSLVYQSSVQNGNDLTMSIQALDLKTGDITTIFQAPATAWIDFMSVSPDGRQL